MHNGVRKLRAAAIILNVMTMAGCTDLPLVPLIRFRMMGCCGVSRRRERLETVWWLIFGVSAGPVLELSGYTQKIALVLVDYVYTSLLIGDYFNPIRTPAKSGFFKGS